MKKRYIYTLLFLVPGFFITVLAIGILFGIFYGILWLYVYGDSPWPEWTETIAAAAMIIAFAMLWCSIALTGYFTGKRLETSPGLNVRHVWMSLCASLLPILVIASHQLYVGNLGPKSNSTRCMDYCRELGFDTSGLPPENSGQGVCFCFGERGEKEVTVPMDDLPR